MVLSKVVSSNALDHKFCVICRIQPSCCASYSTITPPCPLSALVEKTCAPVYVRSVSFVLGGAEVFVRTLLFAECQISWSGCLPREYVAITEGFVWGRSLFTYMRQGWYRASSSPCSLEPICKWSRCEVEKVRCGCIW